MLRCTACIATYRRPEGLRRLLESVEQQELGDDIALDIVVVDNDPESARNEVERFATKSRFPVLYLTQPEPNISITRNVAVAAATGELIWFVDDDEIASPACLSLLVEALRTYDAAGVFGPVLPEFDGPVPEWIRQSSAFNRPIGVTGRKSFGYRTSNTLVRAAVLTEIPGPFDPEFGVSGGSDSLLFRALAERGHRFIDSGEASVTEVIPAGRAQWQWMRTRFRRQGQNYARQIVVLSGGVANRRVIAMLAKASVQIPAMAALAMVHRSDRLRRSEALLRLWSNIGKFEGVAGVISVRMH